MSKIQFSGAIGYTPHFTTEIPMDLQKALAAKVGDSPDKLGFELTPQIGAIPGLEVALLKEKGITVPNHWGNLNDVIPLVEGLSFFFIPHIPHGIAMDMVMKGVNVRNGLRMTNALNDTLPDGSPCQSYWCGPEFGRTYYVDGYVPEDGTRVMQFRVLRGQQEIAEYDIARFSGIEPDHEWIDGFCGSFYLPNSKKKLEQPFQYGGRRSGYNPYYEDETLEGAYSLGPTLGVPKGATRNLESSRSAPEEVGMGAGAFMRQKHPDIGGVNRTHYTWQKPIVRIATRLVWLDQWNDWATKCSQPIITHNQVTQMRAEQDRYVARMWRQIGGKQKTTFVSQFPTVK